MKQNRLFIFCAILFSGFLNNVFAQNELISTIAGTGTAGYSGDGAAATLAKLNLPYQMSLDAAGNLYIAEQSSNVIRMVNAATGIISTVAGNGTSGFTGDGTAATGAELRTPTGVVVDGSGNIYIADEGNNRIRVVSGTTGIINTICGSSNGFSGDGGLATAAKISQPRNITLDASGNIYFSDGGNQRIRMINATTGIINTVAGGGTPGAFAGDGLLATNATVRLNGPRGLAVDGAGNIYIADMTNQRIRMVTAATGIISTIAGSSSTAGFGGDGGPATSALLSAPTGVSVDGAGNVYIADAGNNRIRMIDVTTGNINTIAGSSTVAGFAGDGGLATAAQLSGPVSIALVSPTTYYIADRGNNRVRRVKLNSIPTFVNPTSQPLTVCENTAATDISAMLSVIDSDVAQTENWFIQLNPINGVLIASDVETSNGGTVSPVGITYMPNTGYSGNDTFIVGVFDGFDFAYDTVYVTVNPLANVGVITGLSSLCIGNTTTLTDTASGGTGSWITTNGAALVDASGNITGEYVGTDTVMYIVGNPCGFDTASFIVNVNTFFVPAVTISANPGSTSCFGLQVSYTATPVNGGPSPTYQWQVNGVVMATGNTFMYTPNNGDTISVTMTSDAACILTPIANDTMIMTVNAGITPSVTISAGAYGDTVCAGTFMPFTATPVNGGASPSYVWNVNGFPMGAGNPFYYTPDSADVISCILTSSLACAIPDTAVSESITMTVNTVQVPAVTISVNPGSVVCAGTPVTFAVSSTLYGGIAPFYRWTKNGINVATGPDYTILSPVAGDSVYCMLGSSSSCAVPDSAFSNAFSLVIDYPLIPVVTITSISGSVIGLGAHDTVVALVTNATASPTYQWLVNGIPVPGATSSYFVVGDTTEATATISCVAGSGNACDNTGISNALTITVTDAVKQLSLTNTNMQLLPNPNKGTFTIQGSLPADDKEVTLQVTDIIGQVVYMETAQVQNGSLKKQISLGGQLPSGVYLMHIITNNANSVIRFSINR